MSVQHLFNDISLNKGQLLPAGGPNVNVFDQRSEVKFGANISWLKSFGSDTIGVLSYFAASVFLRDLFSTCFCGILKNNCEQV